MRIGDSYTQTISRQYVLVGIIVWILDYFVPSNIEDINDKFRARVLVAILLTYSLILVAAVISVSSTPEISISALSRIYNLLIIPIFGFLCLLSLYKLFGSHQLCGNIAVSFVSILIFATTFYSGGPYTSPVNFLTHIPVILAFCILGKKAGASWAAIVLIIQASLIASNLLGFDFPNTISNNYLRLNTASYWLISFTASAAVVIAYEMMNHQLISERDDQRLRLEYLATHDELTGLANRVLFNTTIATAIKRASRGKNKLCLLFIDLDGFKNINDSCGHSIGDEVLISTGQRIRNSIRSSDMVARLGGDEFAVILEGIDNRANVGSIIKKVETSISSPLSIREHQVSVGASIGCAIYPADGSTVEELLNNADTLMYSQKNQINKKNLTGIQHATTV